MIANLEMRKAKFFSRVEIPGHRGWRTACWEWKGSLTTDVLDKVSGGYGGGYGCLRVDGRWVRAHQYVLELLKISVADGMVVGHSCDNRKCVNPNHLQPQTQGENLKDAYKRGHR